MSARYTTHDLSSFFDHGARQGATHMFVLHEQTGTSAKGKIERNDQHYYVKSGEDPRNVIKRCLAEVSGFKELLEVYNLRIPKGPQLRERYACNF